MATSDFLENAISSKIDEKSLNDLTSSLENTVTRSSSVITSSDNAQGKKELVWTGILVLLCPLNGPKSRLQHIEISTHLKFWKTKIWITDLIPI